MKKTDIALLVFLFSLSFVLNIVGLSWGLPNEARNRFYPKDQKWYQLPEEEDPLYLTRPWASYHPDEGVILLGLSNMNPSALDFNPHYFSYPSLSIYITGGLVRLADALHIVQLESSKFFYLEHPGEISRIYLVGRLIAATMAAIAVVLLYFCVKMLFDVITGLFSALALAVMPLWVRDSHFMLINIPSAAWMVVCGFFAVFAMKRRSRFGLMASAFAAGLAASTKYPAGLVILLPLFVILQGSFTEGKRSKAVLLATSLVLFVVAFLLGTPYSLLAFDEFVHDVSAQGQLHSGIPSILVLGSQFVVAQGIVLGLVTLAGLVLSLTRFREPQYKFVILWVVAGLGQRLLSWEDYARYLTTALPPFAICAGIGLNAIRLYITRLMIPYRRVLGFAASLLLLLPAAGYSANIDLLMAGNSTQDTAASWLDTNVPNGETVGIFRSLYFDMPPINAEKYAIVDLTKPELKSSSSPKVVVVSSLSTQLVAAWLEQTHWLQSGNAQVKVFSQRPLSVWTWPIATWPNDWAYTFPDIQIDYK